MSIIREKWIFFRNNFTWPEYVWLLNSWLTKSVLVVPLLGYIIIFNDSVAGRLTFEKLAPTHATWGFLHAGTGLRFTYFGMIFLGISNFIYLAARPRIMALAENSHAYIQRGFDTFSLSNFRSIVRDIRNSKHTPYEQWNFDKDWDEFNILASGTRDSELKMIISFESKHNWTESKFRYESMLRDILRLIYYIETKKRRFALAVAIMFAVIGLCFTAIPSADLFLRVASITFI